MHVLTVFAIPKPFRSQVETIQRNALRSWKLLGPQVDILLFGDDEGTAKVAQELGIRHYPRIARNEYGTPLLSDILEQAKRLTTQAVLCYVNADIILMSDFLSTVQMIARQKQRFLLVGRRWDVDIRELLLFSGGWEQELRAHVAAQGRLHPVTGMDYFVFPRQLLRDIPPFAIGRSAWDNWLIYRARLEGVPVVDATEAVMAVHQDHDYSHIPRDAVDVWTGPEAARNLQLAGGQEHVFTLQDATHMVVQHGCRFALSRWHLERHLVTIPMLHPSLIPIVVLARGLLGAMRRARTVLGRGHARPSQDPNGES